MITIYTALGQLFGMTDRNGAEQFCVMMDTKEYTLDKNEFLLWSQLNHSFMNHEDLENSFQKLRHSMHIFDDVSYEQIISRLEQRGLIISGQDMSSFDALHNLIGSLNMVPRVRFDES